MTPCDPSSSAEYRDCDRNFTRQRQDWLYCPLQPSAPPLRTWGPHIAAGIATLLLMCLAFPAAKIVVDILERL